jgi:hypothetical protein
MGLLNFPAAAWDMHLRLADFHFGKLGGDFFQDWVVGFAGLTGRKPIGDNRRRRVCKFLIVFVSDVFNRSCHERHSRLKGKQKRRRS